MKTNPYVPTLIDRALVVALNRAICKCARIGRKVASERERYLESMPASLPAADEVVCQLIKEAISLLGGEK